MIRRVEDLAPLLEGISTLLINGDGSEQLARRFIDRGLKMRNELVAICQERGIELIEHRGNHDPHVPGPPYRWFSEGSVLVHHGDAVYPRVSPWSREVWRHRKTIAKFVEANWRDDFTMDERFDFAKALELDVPQIPHPKTKNKILRAVKLLAWPPHRPLLVLGIWANAGRRISGWGMEFAPAAQLIICGHFHRTNHHRAGDGRWVMMTGPFASLGRPSCVDLDEAEGMATLRDVQEDSTGKWAPAEARLTLKKSPDGQQWQELRADSALDD